MRLVVIVCITLVFSLPAYMQSGHINPNSKREVQIEFDSPKEKTAKEILIEINEQIKQRLQTLVAQKKGNISNNDLTDLEKQKIELATKGATIVEAKQNKSAEDWFYLGILYVAAENFDGAKRSFERFLGEPESKTQKFAEQRRTTYATLSAASIIRNNLEKAESWFSKYLENSGENQVEEEIKIRLMFAEKYEQEKNYDKVLSHTERAYTLAKELASSKPSSRQSFTDKIVILNELLFQAYVETGKSQKAVEILDDLRQTAVSIESAGAYLTAVEQKTKYLIETGKKDEALNFLRQTLKNVNTDFKDKNLQGEITSRLKRKERQYEILGEKALEIENVDHWLPKEVMKKLSSLQGKVVLIHFWATWCSFCISQIPQLNEWAENYKKDGLEVIGLTRYYNQVEGQAVNNTSELEFLTKFKEKFSMEYPIAVAKDAINHHNYNVQSLPTTVLIDRRGIVRYIESGAGPIREAEIKRMIQKLLLEK
jgi:thiol-disulfide isomerase/thioredoxin